MNHDASGERGWPRTCGVRPEAREVVVVAPPDKPFYITMWVLEVKPNFVEFYSGIHRWHVVNFIRPDGRTLGDDQGRQVKVFEYLGEI